MGTSFSVDAMHEYLHNHFGLTSFRPTQQEVIESVLARQNVLVIMPTGGGKSLCYQLPALLMEGLAIVVSPLISLMQDQVSALERRNIPATFINSSLTPAQQAERIQSMAMGAYKLVYVAPERFRQRNFVETLKRLKISLLAVDEAHCISQWGHDFRPDYLQMGRTLTELGNPQVIALTATATPEVREDIVKHLNLPSPQIFVSGFARENLEFRISQTAKVTQKLERLSYLITTHKTGIIYCSTRKHVEQISDHLNEWDVAHVQYHAGLSDVQRKSAQEKFIRQEIDVAVATNAFGMGIDRPDLRFVAHFQLPGSIEAYYQEAGRAGRDGKPSVCELLFNYRDRQIQEFFIQGSNPSADLIRRAYGVLCEAAIESSEIRLSIEEITERIPGAKNSMAVSAALSFLSHARCIERFDIPGQRIRGTRLMNANMLPSDLKVDDELLRSKEIRDRRKLESVIKFAYSTECRQTWILRYFGERATGNCGRCDFCKEQSSGQFTAKPKVRINVPSAATAEKSTIRLPSDAELIIVQKVLSSVARMSFRDDYNQWQPKYGKGKIVDVLLGSRSAPILEAGLHELSTYGLLKECGRDYLKALLDELEVASLIAKINRDGFDLITLTSTGAQAMRGQITYKLSWPALSASSRVAKKSDASRSKEDDTNEPIDEVLFEKLRQKRKEMAKAKGAPAYTIFHDSVLRQLAALKPTSVAESQGIAGVGPVRMRTVLPAFLEVIENHLAS